MDAREIKRKIKEWKARTPAQMEANDKVRKGLCPQCGLRLVVLSSGIGGLVTMTCQPCGGYFASISTMVPFDQQLETVKHFIRDLKKMLKSEERRKEQLERQDVEKLITHREVVEQPKNPA